MIQGNEIIMLLLAPSTAAILLTSSIWKYPFWLDQVDSGGFFY